MPRISVIVPALNEEGYIENCLKSLRRQDYEDYEVIVVDGGSTDSTVEVASRYADIVLGPARPVGKARNIGARRARGEILLFVDADTVLPRGTLRKVHELFESDEKLAALSFLVKPYDGTILDTFAYLLTNSLFKASTLVKLPLLPGICSAYRRSAFFAAGGFDERRQLSEDISLSLRVKGKVLYYSKHAVYTSTRRVKKTGYSNVAKTYIVYGLLLFYLNKLVSYPVVR